MPSTPTPQSPAFRLPLPALLVACSIASSAGALAGELSIRTAHDSASERATVEQLRRLVAEHGLERWQFTDEVVVDEQAGIPFSHPVLTLNISRLENDDELVTAYVHEQFHWWLSDSEERREAAIAELRELFPDAPGREGGGARNPYSSLLHLVVCDLELQAGSMVLGEERTRELLAARPYYTWVYERVLGDPRVRAIAARHGFLARLGGHEPELEIELEHDSEAERRTAERLRALIEEHDLDRFQLTEQVRIDERSTPHSHPVLTLHTRHLGNDERLLSAYVHEQFHWMEEAMRPQRDAAMARLRELFPDAPDEGGGQDGRDGVLLHLIVCDLELQAMTELIGEERARALLAGKSYYRWIYDKVLEDPRVREVTREWGFLSPSSSDG